MQLIPISSTYTLNFLLTKLFFLGKPPSGPSPRGLGSSGQGWPPTKGRRSRAGGYQWKVLGKELFHSAIYRVNPAITPQEIEILENMKEEDENE